MSSSGSSDSDSEQEVVIASLLVTAIRILVDDLEADWEEEEGEEQQVR